MVVRRCLATTAVVVLALAVCIHVASAVPVDGFSSFRMAVRSEETRAVQKILNAQGKYDEIPKDARWRAGIQTCEGKEGKRLCLRDEYCPDGAGKAPAAGALSGEGWAPVSDANNEWVYIGSDASKQCKTHTELHGETPVWGRKKGMSKDFKGSVLCCDMALEKLSSTGPSWEDASTHCIDKKERLCIRDEYCPDGKGKAPLGGMLGMAAWAALQEDTNEWLAVGRTFPLRLLCGTHTEIAKVKPAWGEVRKEKPHRGVVKCCPDGYFHTVKGKLSYTDAVDFCKNEKKRLCTKAEYCPEGAGSYARGGPRPGIAWSPVGDEENTWISTGFKSKETACKTHTELKGAKPEWGMKEGWAGHIQCCEGEVKKENATAPANNATKAEPEPEAKVEQEIEQENEKLKSEAKVDEGKEKDVVHQKARANSDAEQKAKAEAEQKAKGEAEQKAKQQHQQQPQQPSRNEEELKKGYIRAKEEARKKEDEGRQKAEQLLKEAEQKSLVQKERENPERMYKDLPVVPELRDSKHPGGCVDCDKKAAAAEESGAKTEEQEVQEAEKEIKEDEEESESAAAEESSSSA